MAVGRTKSGPANGAGKKAKAAVSSANGSNANDSASPTTPTAEVSSQQPTFAAYGPGKPDKVVYDREQEQIKVEIDALQVKVVSSCSVRLVNVMSFILHPVCREGQDQLDVKVWSRE